MRVVRLHYLSGCSQLFILADFQLVILFKILRREDRDNIRIIKTNNYNAKEHATIRKGQHNRATYFPTPLRPWCYPFTSRDCMNSISALNAQPGWGESRALKG
jgi:hypothetical protein